VRIFDKYIELKQFTYFGDE